MTTTAPPLVDVLVPTYRRPRFLEQAIRSVLDQTYVHWRLVVSEDAPDSDDVARLVAGFGDDRLSYRTPGSHVGAAANMTQLLESASAPYVAFLHDDDLWTPRFLAEQVRFLEDHPECGLVFCGNHEIDARGEVTRTPPFALPEGAHPPNEFVPLNLVNNMIGMETLVVRLAAFDTVGRMFDESLPALYDYEMYLRLAVRFPVGYRRSNDAYYRVHGAQITFNSRDRSREHLAILDGVEQDAAAAGLALDPRLLCRERAKWHLSAALDSGEVGHRRATATAIWSAVRESPAALGDPKLPLAVAALVAGRRGSVALAALRRYVRRHPIPGRLRLARAAARRRLR